MLDALSRALRLDAAERAHLFHLAGTALPLPAGDWPRDAPPELAAFVHAQDPDPAWLIGPRADVLAWNDAARRVIGTPTQAPDGRPNLLWWLLTSDERDGEQRRATARSTLGRFRVEHARRIGDPEFAALVEALDRESAQFRAWWPRHEVVAEQLGTKEIAHPELGLLRLHHLQSVPTSHPDLRLTLFAAADDATRAALAAAR